VAAFLIAALAGCNEQPDPGPAGTFHATARSIELNAWNVDEPIRPLSSIRLEGDFVYSARGRVLDMQGRTIGNSIRVEDEMEITGEDIELSWFRVAIRAHDASLVPDESGGWISAGGRMVVRSSRGMALPEGPGKASRRSGSVLFEPNKDRSGTGLRAETVRWLDPPRELSYETKRRNIVSWAGDGTVTSAGERAESHTFGGVIASSLHATIVRGDTSVTVDGRGAVAQAYVDGLPRFRTAAKMVVKAHSAPILVNSRPSFTFKYSNEGKRDLCILAIKALTPAAKWANMALYTMPYSFGGEEHELPGGDTDDFGKRYTPVPIFGGRIEPLSAVLGPGFESTREISFSVPRNTPPGRYEITFVVEGNFDPVHLTVPIVVGERSSPTPSPSS
jgi:hypothetical protein